MDLTYVYTIKRSAMGRQPMFCEWGPEMCDHTVPDASLAKDYILRNPVHSATQHAPACREHQANTIRAEYQEAGTRHTEGGWPKDVNVFDLEATHRYRRKLEKEEDYVRFVSNNCNNMEHFVLQNNAIDLYQTYYSELEMFPSLEQCDCRVMNVYRNSPARSAPRPVNSICWQPDGGHMFAVTYPDVDLKRDALSSLDAYVWDTERADTPIISLQPPCAMLDLQYSPRDACVLAGALVNGQVCTWDTRAATTPTSTCAVHVAHRDLVRSVLFIASKSGLEFFSGGSDGAVKWWDMRNMKEPTDELILHVVKSSNEYPTMAKSNGVSILEYERAIPSRFMAGTENGLVLGANRKGKTHVDKLPGRYEAHLGPVWACERNPSFPKNFLTVGDWTARVWSEELRESALMSTAAGRQRVTHGTWSPTRCSVMVLASSDGVVCVWDLLRRQDAPVLHAQLCREPLLRVAVHQAGAVVACGSAGGDVYLIELSRNLIASEGPDKANLASVLEREYKRERILDARLREIKLKHRQEETGGAGGAGPAVSMHSAMHLPPSADDKDLLDATNEYFAIVKKEARF